MKKFTKNSVENLRSELNKVLEAFGNEHNMDLDIGRITFGDQVTAKLTVQYKQDLEPGEYPETKESIAFIRKSKIIGIDKSLLHKSFKSKGDNVVLLGYNSRAPKNPMNFTVNNKPFKSSLGYFKSLLNENMSSYVI